MHIISLDSVGEESAERIVQDKAVMGRNSLVRKLLKFSSLIFMSWLSYALISHFVLMSVQVVGASMMPTLHDSQRLLLNRWVYLIHPPRLGDIVVFRDLADNSFAVKRIIGLPGDMMTVKNGLVYRNGKPLDELYLPAGTQTFPFMGQKEQSCQCGKDQFWVLGDNRFNSADSRTYGAVSREDILGQIIR